MFASKMFVLLFSLVLIQIANANLDGIHDKCRGETGIDKSHVDEANKGNFAEDTKFKCYLKCVTSEVGLMNPSGEITMTEEALQIFPDDFRENIRTMVTKCGPGLEATDLCERAFELHTCAHKSFPELYVLI